MRKVRTPKGPAEHQLDFVVHTFRKSIAAPRGEEAQDFSAPVFDGGDEGFQRGMTGRAGFFQPLLQLASSFLGIAQGIDLDFGQNLV